MAKILTEVLPLKGWAFYSGRALWEEGKINLQSALQIEAEPDNPYDRYAVAVFLQTYHEKGDPIKVLIGYLPRTEAARFQFLLLHKQIQQIAFKKIKGEPPYHLDLQIHYHFPWWLKGYFPIWKYFHPQHKPLKVNRYDENRQLENKP